MNLGTYFCGLSVMVGLIYDSAQLMLYCHDGFKHSLYQIHISAWPEFCPNTADRSAGKTHIGG